MNQYACRSHILLTFVLTVGLPLVAQAGTVGYGRFEQDSVAADETGLVHADMVNYTDEFRISKKALTPHPFLHAPSVLATFYVWTNSPSPGPPYNDWSNAAHDIQSAVEAAGPGDTVVVTNGVYDTGGWLTPGGALSNRVVVTNAIMIRSVNGPEVTTILGAWDPFSGGNGSNAIRCIYLAQGATLSGFTLSQGATQTTGDPSKDRSGGGAWCDGTAALSNCVIAGNQANESGGGVYGGTLRQCTIISNTALYGGGLHSATATNCVLSGNAADFGGGANFGTLRNCTITMNTATNGGGVCDGLTVDCLITSNSAPYGGGAAYGTLEGCTLSANQAINGGGTRYSTASNCTFRGNSASDFGGGANFGTLLDCLIIGNGAFNGGGTADGLVQGCQIVSNMATWGGGSLDGTLSNCTLTGNSANQGGGAERSTLNNCTVSGNSAGNGTGGGVMDSTLDHCTLSGNSAGSGGGAMSSTLNNCLIVDNSAEGGAGVNRGTLNNCTLAGNSARLNGGGAYGATLNNCVLSGNFSNWRGGGAYFGALYNCTLTGNSANDSGGGAWELTLNNCIAYYNEAPTGANYANATINYSCTTPDPGGVGNITNEPMLAGFAHVAAGSPCLGAGSSAYAASVDIDGEAWLNPPSMGCDEVVPGSVTGALNVRAWASCTNLTAGVQVQFRADISGRLTASEWRWGDGHVSSNQTYAAHVFPSNGVYDVILVGMNESFPLGVTATVTVQVLDQMVYFVAVGNSDPLAPHTSWATAATNIQDALDAATQVGALIMVSNGVYSTGGRVRYGSMTNRVMITNGMTVRSVNGPTHTIIEGAGVLGDHAVRCAYVGDQAALTGFTLTHGGTRTNGDVNREQSGGGVWGEPSATLSNCLLNGNTAFYAGGGVYGGTVYACTFSGNTATSNLSNACGGGASDSSLFNCSLSGNSAVYGGGASKSTLNNCTLSNNRVRDLGGGASWSTLNNCIVYFNASIGMDTESNYYDCYLQYCCTTPDPGGLGNITQSPTLLNAAHIAAASPCVGAGNALAITGSDRDGDSWNNPPSIGCDEPTRPSTGSLAVAISANVTRRAVEKSVLFQADIQGIPVSNRWLFADGQSLDNRAYGVEHSWTATGTYPVVLTAWNDDHPDGVSATITVEVVEGLFYVNSSNPTPVAPYTSWATAATNIQDAVDEATLVVGTVVVTDGVYYAGARVAPGAILLNRVVVTNGVILRSVNGPDVTVIDGAGDTVRCAYLANGSQLIGFTLNRGRTLSIGDFDKDRCGGGILSPWAIVSNCVIVGNSAVAYGGGVCGGTLTLFNCTLIGNSAGNAGGGAKNAIMNNCILLFNQANFGGGAASCMLNNCTIVGNSATYSGGGTYGGTLNNCISYYNGAHYVEANYYSGSLSYSCTTPDPGGVGNITNEPVFVNYAAGNVRLLSNSPCINAGTNRDWMTGSMDLDGNPRIYAGGRVDMGAYEYQGSLSIIPTNWLASYGLVSDGSVDQADTDGDGMSNWQEWRSGTQPTNGASFLGMLAWAVEEQENVGFVVRWAGETGVTYRLQRGTNLLDGFASDVASNVPGAWPVSIYTDTAAAAVSGPWFYRVVVE